MTLPVRQYRRARPRRSTGRASSRLTRTRLVAAFVLLLSGGALYALTTLPVFALDPGSVQVEGLRYTDPAAARAALGLEEGRHGNLFHLPTARLEAALMALPTVRGASVQARLPDGLHVAVEERVPILQWRHAGSAWLIDVEGVILAPAPLGEGLAAVDDQRTTSQSATSEAEAAPGAQMASGAVIAPLDLEVARVLGAVTPAHLGSAASELTLSVSDADGWVMESDRGWRAIFGHYVPESRPPASIPGQLTCLHALLLSEGEAVAEVMLSLSDDACGTYRPRPAPSPAPARSGRRGNAISPGASDATPSVSP